MNSKVNVLSLLLSGMFLISACGAQATPTVAPAATTAPAATSAPAATTAPAATAAPAADIPDSASVATADSSLGKILVDDKGWVLYMYTKDTANTSNCYDACAKNWPPLLTKNKPTAGTGTDSTLVGTTTRKDGTMQVTYKGLPLYYFLKDTAAGETKGQDVGKAWYVISPAGDPVGMAK